MVCADVLFIKPFVYVSGDQTSLFWIIDKFARFHASCSPPPTHLATPPPPPPPHPPPPYTPTTHHTPHMQRNHRTVGSSAQMCSHPFKEHIAFHRHLVWLLSDTHKSARPLSQLKSLKPSDAYINQWVKPPSIQTMACLAISLTNVTYCSLERRKYISAKLYSKFKQQTIFEKSHLQNVGLFVPASMSVWAMWVNVSPLNYMWSRKLFAES